MLAASVAAVDDEEPRLVTLEFDDAGAKLLRGLYRQGRVIQYSYVRDPLELWDVQNRFAARPWAFEPPSAALPLNFALLDALRRRGVELAWLTHAAGISSTGSPTLDRRLPLPERYELPESTIAALESAHARGGRVVAVGTTVVRALESSAAEHGRPRAGAGEARLILGPGFRARVVSGILTGMHEPSTSHYSLLEAFAPRALLDRATEGAARAGFLQHEFGDSCLIL
jgi:S-adenosylmethionine:tRNA ribosyltransferase-isomerase